MSNSESLLKKLEELRDILEKRIKVADDIKSGKDPEEVFNKEINEAAKNLPKDFWNTEAGKEKIDIATIVAFKQMEPEECIKAGFAMLREKNNENSPAEFNEFKRLCAARLIKLGTMYLSELKYAQQVGFNIGDLFNVGKN